MKKLILLFLVVSSIGEIQSQHNVPLNQWVQDYAQDLEKLDWRERVVKYGWDSDYETHQALRDAYHNLKIEILKSVDNGTGIMAWLKVSAIWEGGFEGDVLESAKTGSKVEWEEVWSFNGKFGGELNLLVDKIMKLKSVGLRCMPEKE